MKHPIAKWHVAVALFATTACTADMEEPIAPSRPAFSNPSRKIEYTYTEAVDTMALIMHRIGKDINMSYGTDVSTASTFKAYLLLYSLGFTIPYGYQTTFDIPKIINYLKNNHIILMRGDHTEGNIGHAWVGDGYRYCVDLDGTTILSMFIHCDWGWDGKANGFYSGAVFETGSYNFAPTSFLAVKREWN